MADSFADQVAASFSAGAGSDTTGAGPAPADESPGAMLIKAVNAGDAAGVEAAVRACMATEEY